MREILFRGKEINGDKWISGYLVCESGIGDWITSDPVRPETVGQFTGLYDKNCQMIFEGDIIQNKGCVFSIEYMDGVAGFYAKPVEDNSWSPCLNRGTMMHYEVVGNIHDNPELLG